ncbi:hypothetical protein COLO4_05091 [Corchorus olitorius]|uniref:Uncharacterized protein n=1 Tax=Corchorus olitorius TaxID=93759 RepID=A0A1R3KRW6_9ROSI|nr:hypothetical protein COLO4_05091 [Corchorus olitorius]
MTSEAAEAKLDSSIEESDMVGLRKIFGPRDFE